MRTYFLNLWDSLRRSFWLVPSLCLAAAAALSLAVPEIDDAIVAAGWEGPAWIYTNTATARATLAAMAGAMIAATGTVFSVTIVTLSLTSQQFGPRLLRRFMNDLVTQYTLGAFVGTGFYCLFVLRSVGVYGDEVTALHLSAIVAVGLAVVSIIMLIAFINHITQVIQAPYIVASVGQDLDAAIVRLFPASMGEAVEESEREKDPPATNELEPPPGAIAIASTVEGYIQGIAGSSVMELATEHDLVIRLRVQPGEFVTRSAHLADVWSSPPSDGWPVGEDDLSESLNESVIVGIRRTPRQDVASTINELVEVAVRALSPGINDPFTAMSCIDRLGASMGRLACRMGPSSYRRDEAGTVRVIARRESFANLLDSAFGQIRRYGAGDVAVTIRLLDTLASIARHVDRDQDRDAVRRHVEMVGRTAKSFAEEYDRNSTEERFECAVAALERPA